MTETKPTNKIGRERPLSPHLQVYKPQFTSMLSIMHRGSIVAMYFVSLVFVYFLALQAFGFECMCANWLTTSETGIIVGKLLLSGVALAASYWIMATIRHLLWDIGYGFELDKAYRTAKISVMATLILAGIIIYYIWS
jgi:succinate dehydrogenase / fumarate reductase cytochrome b subunit